VTNLANFDPTGTDPWDFENATTPGHDPYDLGVSPQATSLTPADLLILQAQGFTVTDKAPVLAATMSSQTEIAGKPFAFALPTGTFTDPQGSKMTYGLSMANGDALPSWLHFNAVHGTFSGKAPGLAQALDLVVIATDALGLASTPYDFTLTIPGHAAGPSVEAATGLIGVHHESS
jgi:hypothetical protein